jgi:hypothetical protein
MPEMASSTSSQKWRKAFLEGSPDVVVDSGVILEDNYFYTFRGTCIANDVLSIFVANGY